MRKEPIVDRPWFQPCGGFFLQGSVKALTMVDVGVEFAMIVLHSSGIYAGHSEWKSNLNELIAKHAPIEEVVKEYARPFHWGFHFFYNLISLLMSYYLYKYAKTRDEKRLGRWLIISWVFFLPAVALFLSHSFWIGWKHYEIMCAAGCGVFIPYKLYGLWVVHRFIGEIRYYGGFNSALTELSDADVEGFFEGHKEETTSPLIQVENGFDRNPYKRDFEIPLSRLELDKNCPLGSGQYGTVYKGILREPPRPSPASDSDGYLKADRVVAVKTVSPNASLCYFKALLSELKILSYLGQHENVVNLVGACTSEIKKRQLYIVVDFCPMGSLLNYLKSTRGVFVDLYHPSHPSTELGGYLTYPVLNFPSTLNLLKWAMQTAAGMEYIASLKVIHGDLAARNILLSMDMQVKIADFGLSRQLYSCYNYRKNSDEPLPWRWMAIEALRDLNFSTQSDVWAFGITIWEFFTCGETPYPGYNYSNDFLKSVQCDQLRPEQPTHASAEIYSLMLSCWDLDPSERPSFGLLKSCFEQMYLEQLDKSGSDNRKPQLSLKASPSPYIPIEAV